MTRDVASRRHLIVALLACLVGAAPAAAQPRVADRPPVPRDTFDAWMARLSNAGRWGREDQLGTLNLVTPEARRRAARGVRDGVSISLSRDVVARPDPEAGTYNRFHVFRLGSDSVVGAAADSILIVAHGYSSSHLDALSHFAYRGRMYNGFGLEARAPTGAAALGVERMRAGIVTRGVLVDVPRLRGVAYLPPSAAITVEELERWERRTGVRIGAGDVLLLRTGRAARTKATGPWDARAEAAGPHPSVASWLRARGVAALGSDAANESNPSVVPGVGSPMHVLTIVALGMPIMDNLELEAVAEYAARQSRPAFLFVAAPLPIRGTTGSLLNPLAIF